MWSCSRGGVEALLCTSDGIFSAVTRAAGCGGGNSPSRWSVPAEHMWVLRCFLCTPPLLTSVSVMFARVVTWKPQHSVIVAPETCLCLLCVLKCFDQVGEGNPPPGCPHQLRTESACEKNLRASENDFHCSRSKQTARGAVERSLFMNELIHSQTRPPLTDTTTQRRSSKLRLLPPRSSRADWPGESVVGVAAVKHARS